MAEAFGGSSFDDGKVRTAAPPLKLSTTHPSASIPSSPDSFLFFLVCLSFLLGWEVYELEDGTIAQGTRPPQHLPTLPLAPPTSSSPYSAEPTTIRKHIDQDAGTIRDCGCLSGSHGGQPGVVVLSVVPAAGAADGVIDIA